MLDRMTRRDDSSERPPVTRLDYDAAARKPCYCYRPLLRLSWRLDNLPRVIAAVMLTFIVGDFMPLRWRCTRCGRIRMASSHVAWEINRSTRRAMAEQPDDHV